MKTIVVQTGEDSKDPESYTVRAVPPEPDKPSRQPARSPQRQRPVSRAESGTEWPGPEDETTT